MAEYWQFLGRKVTVRYRVGEILLSATGLFSADSGRSIFLEQHTELRGAPTYFRWEIPYAYIYRIEPEVHGDAPLELKSAGELSKEEPAKAAAASAGESTGNSGSVIPFPQRPKTA